MVIDKFEFKVKFNKNAEQNLIADNFAKLAKSHKGSFNLLDDCATISHKGHEEFVISSDMLIAGVHFFKDDEPEKIAYKALAVNVSDIIAKGALPKYYLLNIALNNDQDSEWLRSFSHALSEFQNDFGIVLIGGDSTYNNSELVISITIIGVCDGGKMVTRLGAKVGDGIFVSGNIGSAKLGLDIIKRANSDVLDMLHGEEIISFKEAYFFPKIAVGSYKLIRDYASASMDISDGLLGDLMQLLAASKVCAEVDIDEVPILEAARRIIKIKPAILIDMLSGGDDYQILCTVEQTNEAGFLNKAKEADIKFHKIGRVIQSEVEVGLIKLSSTYDYSDILGNLGQFSYSHL